MQFDEKIQVSADEIRLNLTGANNKAGRVKVTQMKRSNVTLEVYAHSDTAFVSGPNVFTALAMIEPKHSLYKSMPIKFKTATLAHPRSKNEKLPDTTTNSATVYVNFMSHVDYKIRARHSGRVEVKKALANNKRFRSKSSRKALGPVECRGKRNREAEVEIESRKQSRDGATGAGIDEARG